MITMIMMTVYSYLESPVVVSRGVDGGEPGVPRVPHLTDGQDGQVTGSNPGHLHRECHGHRIKSWTPAFELP